MDSCQVIGAQMRRIWTAGNPTPRAKVITTAATSSNPQLA
jgi:hypothetical protein